MHDHYNLLKMCSIFIRHLDKSHIFACLFINSGFPLELTQIFKKAFVLYKLFTVSLAYIELQLSVIANIKENILNSENFIINTLVIILNNVIYIIIHSKVSRGFRFFIAIKKHPHSLERGV